MWWVGLTGCHRPRFRSEGVRNWPSCRSARVTAGLDRVTANPARRLIADDENRTHHGMRSRRALRQTTSAQPGATVSRTSVAYRALYRCRSARRKIVRVAAIHEVATGKHALLDLAHVANPPLAIVRPLPFTLTACVELGRPTAEKKSQPVGWPGPRCSCRPAAHRNRSGISLLPCKSLRSRCWLLMLD